MDEAASFVKTGRHRDGQRRERTAHDAEEPLRCVEQPQRDSDFVLPRDLGQREVNLLPLHEVETVLDLRRVGGVSHPAHHTVALVVRRHGRRHAEGRRAFCDGERVILHFAFRRFVSGRKPPVEAHAEPRERHTRRRKRRHEYADRVVARGERKCHSDLVRRVAECAAPLAVARPVHPRIELARIVHRDGERHERLLLPQRGRVHAVVALGRRDGVGKMCAVHLDIARTSEPQHCAARVPRAVLRGCHRVACGCVAEVEIICERRERKCGKQDEVRSTDEHGGNAPTVPLGA